MGGCMYLYSGLISRYSAMKKEENTLNTHCIYYTNRAILNIHVITGET